MDAEDNDWKLEMLRRLWGGEGEDTDKSSSDHQRSQKGRKKTVRRMARVDLHDRGSLEEQLHFAERAIDQALLEGCTGMEIIHGKGEGILRSRLVKELGSHPKVTEFNSVQDSRGESGVLSVRFL